MKKVFVLLSALFFVVCFVYHIHLQKLINPNTKQSFTLSLDESFPSSESYVRLLELKNDVALLSVESGGENLLVAGDEVEVGRYGNVLLGSSFKGKVKVLSITNHQVKVYVDVKRSKGFYIMNIFIGGSLLAGGFSAIFYFLLMGSSAIFNGIFKVVRKFVRHKKKKNFKIVQ